MARVIVSHFCHAGIEVRRVAAMGNRRRYVSYLLRLWQADSDGEGVWRAMVEEPLSGEHYGFASPELLFSFLREQIAQRAASAPTEGGASSAPAHHEELAHK